MNVSQMDSETRSCQKPSICIVLSMQIKTMICIKPPLRQSHASTYTSGALPLIERGPTEDSYARAWCFRAMPLQVFLYLLL